MKIFSNIIKSLMSFNNYIGLVNITRVSKVQKFMLLYTFTYCSQSKVEIICT